jgi:hypothetical protein
MGDFKIPERTVPSSPATYNVKFINSGNYGLLTFNNFFCMFVVVKKNWVLIRNTAELVKV